jgi:calcium binding protein 39
MDKGMLYGDAEHEPREADTSKIIDEIFHTDLLLALTVHMKLFDFEARKDAVQVYNFVLLQRKERAVAYMVAHPDILQMLVDGYTDSDIALHCGSILRAIIRHEELDAVLLNDSHVLGAFCEHVQLPTFDVASDAFATLRLMLTKHEALCAKFLNTHTDTFCTHYNTLLQSPNYVTKRQALVLLRELLHRRSNWTMMIDYINRSDNLKLVMNLLRCHTRAVQLDAFRVFQIFVANPNKARGIVDILSFNKHKLIAFVTKFHIYQDADSEQFVAEKQQLLDIFHQLQDTEDGEALAIHSPIPLAPHSLSTN